MPLCAVLLAACASEPDGQRVSADNLLYDARPSRAAPAPVSAAFARLTLPGGKILRVEIASTPAAREKGLMFRTELPSDYGMLFIFSHEQRLLFWMKNTFVDLDMVFISAAHTITSIAHDVPRSREDTPEDLLARRAGMGRYVLELPAGAARRYGLEAGQRLEFGW